VRVHVQQRVRVRVRVRVRAWRVRTQFFASLFAPRSHSSVTTDAWPLYAAQCSGVKPFCAHNNNNNNNTMQRARRSTAAGRGADAPSAACGRGGARRRRRCRANAGLVAGGARVRRRARRDRLTPHELAARASKAAAAVQHSTWGRQ
jgi:hypothetical protein